jgi:lysophospholipase L1-like esterase
MNVRRAAAILIIGVVQFGIFETALRTWGSSEAAPSFQGLFQGDPVIGYRLKPHARTRFATSEFATDIAINGAGFRDDEELGPKAVDERRILLLGDSLVLSVQVPFAQTFGEILERRLNRRASGVRYRVVNAGVQGYGPIEEQLFLRSVAKTVQPDVVVPILFVGNDAEEAYGSAGKLAMHSAPAAIETATIVARLRRLVRYSMVLQILRVRVLSATERITPTLAPPEPPLQSYAARPAARIAEGLTIARQSVEDMTQTSSSVGAQTMVVLMPARFQVDDPDYERLKVIVAAAGGELVRDAASARFSDTLAALPVPKLDLLPALRRTRPGPDLFFQDTVHLTPYGHEVVAEALDEFLAQHSKT